MLSPDAHFSTWVPPDRPQELTGGNPAFTIRRRPRSSVQLSNSSSSLPFQADRSYADGLTNGQAKRVGRAVSGSLLQLIQGSTKTRNHATIVASETIVCDALTLELLLRRIRASRTSQHSKRNQADPDPPCQSWQPWRSVNQPTKCCEHSNPAAKIQALVQGIFVRAVHRGTVREEPTETAGRF